jgi:hypothetical protein
MTYSQILKLQKEHGVAGLQKLVFSGEIWKFQGSAGRATMQMLEAGVVMLPKVITTDYYGNQLPARQMLRSGTKGTMQNCSNFWDRVVDEDEVALATISAYAESGIEI